jgi:hypothetical protein
VGALDRHANIGADLDPSTSTDASTILDNPTPNGDSKRIRKNHKIQERRPVSKLVDRILIKRYTTSRDNTAIVASEADAPDVASALTRAKLEFTPHYGIDGYVNGKPEWGNKKVTFHFDSSYYWAPERLRAALSAFD